MLLKLFKKLMNECRFQAHIKLNCLPEYSFLLLSIVYCEVKRHIWINKLVWEWLVSKKTEKNHGVNIRCCISLSPVLGCLSKLFHFPWHFPSHIILLTNPMLYQLSYLVSLLKFPPKDRDGTQSRNYKKYSHIDLWIPK